MSISLLIYLIEVVSSIGAMLSVLFIGLGVASFILFWFWLDGNDLGPHKGLVPKIFLILIPIVVLVPSERTMWLMLGASALQSHDIPEKVIKAINLKLDEIIKVEDEKDN